MAAAMNFDPHKVQLNKIVSIVKPVWADRRVRILVGVLAIAVAAAWYWFSAASATLTIAGHHGFRRAEVSVWVDGDLESKFEVSGSAKKHFGILQKVEGNFSRSIRVGSGDHTVRVEFRSLTDSTDVTRQCHANVQAGTEATVYINADRGFLSLSFAGGAPRAKTDPEPASGYAKMLQSVFMAIAGSALSATVGFVVQDFLKSRKSALTAKVSS
jgi:hypothetical protein